MACLNVPRTGLAAVGVCPAAGCPVGRVAAIAVAFAAVVAAVGVDAFELGAAGLEGTVRCAEGGAGPEGLRSLKAGSTLRFVDAAVATVAACTEPCIWAGVDVMLSCLSTSRWTPLAADAAIANRQKGHDAVQTAREGWRMATLLAAWVGGWGGDLWKPSCGRSN